MKRFFDGFPSTAHPMAILSAMVCSLSSFYPEALDVTNTEELDITIARLLSKVRTIAAYSYKKSIGQPFVYPQNSLSYCANFLNMMFSVPAEPYEIDEEVVKALNLLPHPARRPRAELLDVDRAPRGQLAGEPVRLDRGRHLRALGPAPRRRQPGSRRDARGTSRPTAATSRSSSSWRRTRTRGFRLMGFGHRVYKNYDPRAQDHQGRRRQGAREARRQGPAARHRQAARRGGAQGPVLHRAQALPERRLLQRHHLPRARHSRRTCSPSCSRSAACPAGSPTGRR